MTHSVRISVVIPTFNEQETIAQLIAYLRECDPHGTLSEIIVADGGSMDNTLAEVARAGAYIVRCAGKGRAMQMNEGAQAATSEIFYFLHADSWPPSTFIVDISHALEQGFTGGCFRLKFDWDHWFLRANAWFTRFNVNWVRFGDQSLFLTRDMFERIGGFDTALCVMEDQEIVRSLRKIARFTVMDSHIVTSARKYRDNGVYRLQTVFCLICILYYLGVSQACLVWIYRKLIH